MEEFEPKQSEQDLKWNEAIQKRPGMYIGNVNHRGFAYSLMSMITEIVNLTKCDTVCLTFRDQVDGVLKFKNIQNPIRKNLAIINRDDLYSDYFLAVLNALSSEMTLSFDDKIENEQRYKNGKTESVSSSTEINCKELKVVYLLDKKIWGNDFEWNLNYLSHELREFCYLNPEVKFEISEQLGEYLNTNTYHFRNGLKDRLDIEILNGHGKCYFNHHIKQVEDNFKLEIAFAFREYSVDQGFIKTYINKELTSENGTHLDGLLKGLTYGVMKYFQANDLMDQYKISEKGIKENLVCMINIEMENPMFSGCVRNKLANSEIIEPIANHVADVLYASIKKDDQSTQKLIDKFKMGM